MSLSLLLLNGKMSSSWTLEEPLRARLAVLDRCERDTEPSCPGEDTARF